MTVWETLKTLDNSGTRRVFDDRKKIYVDNALAKNREVKCVKYVKGYGFQQMNAVLHI